MDIKINVVLTGTYRTRRRNENFQQTLRNYLEEQGDAVFFEIKNQLDNTLIEEMDSYSLMHLSLSSYQIDTIEISNNPPYHFGMYGRIVIHIHESLLKELIKNSALRIKVKTSVEETTAWAEEVIINHVLHESFSDGNVSSLGLKLKVDEAPFQQIQNRLNKTRRNIQARQQYRAITGMRNLGPGFSARRNLPENVARQIAEFSAGPLENNFQRARPLPNALKTETLKLPYETRLAKAENARKPTLSKGSMTTLGKNTTRKNTAKLNTASQATAKKPWWKLW
jgi:hypothetical protein